MMRSLLLLATIAGVAACGAGVKSVERDVVRPATDPVLVQVVDGEAGDYEVVSLSVFDVHPADPLPAEAPVDAVEAMRAEAALRGAQKLLVERLDTPWRRAWFGLGIVPVAGAKRKPCAQPELKAVLADVREEATSCVAALRRVRPGLTGKVTVIFEVDGFGETMRAVATPDSSRDGQVQACALQAVFEADYGAPDPLVCRTEVTIDFGSP